MRIVKRGRAQDDEVMHGECMRCGCVVEAPRGECILDNQDPCETASPYLICPTPKCAKWIYVRYGAYPK